MKEQTQAQFVSNMATMLLIGIWHGIGWGFVLWGVYHGILLSTIFVLRRRLPNLALPTQLATALTFVGVLLGWAFLLNPDLSFMRELFINLMGLHGLGSLTDLRTLYDPVALIRLAVAFSIVLSGLTEAANLPQEARLPVIALLLGIICIVTPLQLGTEPINFVYVQF